MKNIRIFCTKTITLLLTLCLSVYAITPIVASKSLPTKSPALAIKALNPGYTIDGKLNVGEFIELVRRPDSAPLSLAGFSLRYTNSSGKSSNLFKFPEGSQMASETLLLRFAGSPDASQSNLTYTKTLALDAGPLELLYLDTVIDTVCWNGKACLPKFSKANPTSLVRENDPFDPEDPSTLLPDPLDPGLPNSIFKHQADYEPNFDPLAYLPPSEPEQPKQDLKPAIAAHCQGLIFNEVFSYYLDSPAEQFIELYNLSDHSIDLTGCSIKYRAKTFKLSGTIAPSDFYLFQSSTLSIPKASTRPQQFELIDSDGSLISNLTYRTGPKDSSYARFASSWLTTFRPTPNEPNIYQQYRSCPEGKTLNPKTGQCVKAATTKSKSKSNKVCPAGQILNLATGRCKKQPQAKTKKPCQAGYERNPATGRCRKIHQNTGAKFDVVPVTGRHKTKFNAVSAIIAIIVIAAAYSLFALRHKILELVQPLFNLIRKKTKK